MTTLINNCCPKFDPTRWDEKTFTWDKKTFIMESIPTFFHTPFPPMINKKVIKMMNLTKRSWKIEKNIQETLLLFRDPHPFKSEIYLSVSWKVEWANNKEISGTFIAKVFDGPYGAVPKFIKEMDEYLESKWKKAKDYYIHYAYCPKCAEITKHNYMILFAEV